MAEESYVGLFYYVDGNVYAHKWSLAEAPRDMLGILDAPVNYSHTELFEELKNYPYLLEHYKDIVLGGVDKYRNYFPRGRVTYDTNKKRFYILSNKHIAKSNDIILKICQAFNADPKETHTKYYATYETYNEKFGE